MEGITLSEVLVAVAVVGLVQVAKPFLRGKGRQPESWFPVLALIFSFGFIYTCYPAETVARTVLKSVLYGLLAAGSYAAALKTVLAQLGARSATVPHG